MNETHEKAMVLADFLTSLCSDDPDATGEVVALAMLRLSLFRTITNPFRGVDLLVNPPDTRRTIGRMDKVFGMRSGRPTIELRMLASVDLAVLQNVPATEPQYPDSPHVVTVLR